MNKWASIVILTVIVVVIGGAITVFVNPETNFTEFSGGNMLQEIIITNESEYTISPGVLVLHNDAFSMNFLENRAPLEYEPLAEVGDPSGVIALLENSGDVYEVIMVDEISAGGEISAAVSTVENETALVSYMAMIIESNDAVVWLNNIPLYALNTDGGQIGSYWVEILDMGTEQNAPIGSGFAGGQPDQSRGAENSDNGTPTDDVVRHHPDFVNEFVLRFDFLSAPVDNGVIFETAL